MTKKVLCLCTAGRYRSPTMANVLHREYGYDTRAAGVDEQSTLVPVSDKLIEWADEIIFLHQSVFHSLDPQLRWLIKDSGKPYIIFNVMDEYDWMDPHLQEFLLRLYRGAT